MSAKAVAAQEPILQHYAQGFVAAIRARLDGKPGMIDISHWYSIVTFDIMSDLIFGTSFGGVESGELHPWIKLVFDMFRFGPWLRVFREIPGVKSIPNGLKSLSPLLPQWLQQKFLIHLNYGGDLLERRLGSCDDRPDFAHFLTSKPTASFKAGVCYFLGKNENVRTKLTAEIRNTFDTGSELTLAKLAQLPYLNLVIREGLRMFPPAADIFPRIVPPGGEFVMGTFLTEGTHIRISAIAASYSSLNFPDPDKFDPERWTEASVALNPGSGASQPFGQGHRSCIGRNLGLAEVRLLLASLDLNFDFELTPEDTNWLDMCRVYFGWEKRPLKLNLVPVECLKTL